MAIRLDPPAVDAQGLPVVTWEEDRNLFAPGGASPARVACFLRPDANGFLQFVADGSVRHGEFEEARSWEKLVSFAESKAEQHYYSAAERAMLEMLTSKSKSGIGRLIATDGAHVMLANFADEHASVPMHLNCAEASPVEMVMLHDRLTREFIGKRRDLIENACAGEYRWPENKPFMAFTPLAQTGVSDKLNWLANLSAFAVIALMGWGAYSLLLR